MDAEVVDGIDDDGIARLIASIYRHYHYDFRHYAATSLRRRLQLAVTRLHCASLDELHARVLSDPELFRNLLDYLTVQVSEMFRDPGYFLALRREVLPVLATYPSIRIWVAGCSTGEEAYSFAILLHEEGLLARSQIYATDINARALQSAEAGIYDIARIADFSRNHQRSGARHSLSDYYATGYGNAVFDRSLRRHMVFSDHSLATDSVFSEVQLVSCRNVMIYFDRVLQDRAIGLFADSLCQRGFLGLGARETLRFSAHASRFAEASRAERIYQKQGA